MLVLVVHDAALRGLAARASAELPGAPPVLAGDAGCALAADALLEHDFAPDPAASARWLAAAAA
ncbi:hypothetical protein, partial [Roseisolibacter sp. H3M3-2]|uniref:hypothetical protein n=1 Tax=Roseisolibacter sp. H3M3-2 TaxID=3031323 RepID=UPI0023DB464F